MSSSATLLAAGTFVDDGRLRAQAAGGLLVGVDGGAARLLEMGLTPNFALGDFDSLTAAQMRELEARGTQIVATPNQSLPDLDKALAYCIGTLGAQELSVFGATGGRLDHTCAALAALVKFGRQADVRLIDEIGEMRLVPGSLRLTGGDLPGRTLSLIPWGRAEGVSIEGVRWPLRGETLAPGVRDGTSNEITAESVEIKVKSGDLLLYLHHALPGE